MSNTNETVFIIKAMLGGGAERVVSLLSRAAAERGHRVTLMITHQSKAEAVLRDIGKSISVVSVPDEAEKIRASGFMPKIIMLAARLLGKLGFKNKSCVLKYLSRNYGAVSVMKSFFRAHKTASAVAFLYDSIFLTLLSKRKSNRTVISERGDPAQSSGSKTVAAFMKTVFPKADAVVFQSPDAKKWYEDNTPVKGTVIFNPVKPDLPEAYSGERQKKIVNFCRISPEKNLPLLIEAFEKLNKTCPTYDLYVYGDPVGTCTQECLDEIAEKISSSPCKSSIHFLPARSDIHSVIRDYAMFVSSSDYEGMSNSMLEAMALGLPCVCTDCPAGGARAVIRNGENGLLTPVGDANALCDAMKKIIESEKLAASLSENGVKIRTELSVDKIIKKWMELLNG